MSTNLITKDLWPTLTNRVKSSIKPCFVAVAYFGKGASKLLPLPKGSRLVVNASDGAVKSGQTCPDELRALQKKGVEIFSVGNLHAKVFVVGKTAFVGSANVSRNSAESLVEAMLQTTDSAAVAAARSLVSELCLDGLGPERLKELAKIYRPPNIPGQRHPALRTGKQGVSAQFPELHIAHFSNLDYPENERELVKEEEKVAKRERKHRAATHDFCSVLWEGRCNVVPGQQCIQVWDEGAGKVWVYPPAHVLHVKKVPSRAARYIWLEYPIRKRISFNRLAAKLGRGSKTKLRTEGKVKDGAFAEALLKELNS